MLIITALSSAAEITVTDPYQQLGASASTAKWAERRNCADKRGANTGSTSECHQRTIAGTATNLSRMQSREGTVTLCCPQNRAAVWDEVRWNWQCSEMGVRRPMCRADGAGGTAWKEWDRCEERGSI